MAAASAPIQVVPIVAPAVSSAEDCRGDRPWNPVRKIETPHRRHPMWYQPAPALHSRGAPLWGPTTSASAVCGAVRSQAGVGSGRERAEEQLRSVTDASDALSPQQPFYAILTSLNGMLSTSDLFLPQAPLSPVVSSSPTNTSDFCCGNPSSFEGMNR